MNIRYKTRLQGPFRRCIIAPRRNILTRVLCVYALLVSRVPRMAYHDLLQSWVFQQTEGKKALLKHRLTPTQYATV